MFKRLVLSCLALPLLAVPGFAVEPDGRPTVGLVLGGGAAKGLSHVGVIKVLEENQIPVDVVTGTSMGAIVGSLYAAGYSAEEINEIATSLDWNAVFADNVERGRSGFRRKSDDFGFLTDIKISFEDGKLVLPAGLIEGQTLYQELSRFLTRTYSVNNFDELQRPFRAVATDLSTGQEVVMKDGNLVSAVFASMAIPGFVPPVVRNDQYLIDGAFSNNVPVKLAREMGADILIVVDVGDKARPAEELGNVVEVVRQLQILLTRDKTDDQLRQMLPVDILITPDMTGIGVTSFEEVSPLIARGREATEDKLSALGSLRLSDAAWAQYKNRPQVLTSAAPVIDEIRIHQDTKLSNKILRAGLSTEIGEPLEIDQLNRDISTLYDDGVYKRISYEIVQESGRNILDVSATAKESADGYFRLGVEMDSNLKDESTFNLGIAYTKPQINSWGGEIRAEFFIGDGANARAEFYQPIGYEQRFFVEPSISVSQRKDNFFGNFGQSNGTIKRNTYGAGLEGGLLFGRWGELRAGLSRNHVDVKFSEDQGGFDSANTEDTSLGAFFTIDTLNNLAFPSSGNYLEAQYETHIDALGGEADFEKFGAVLIKPFTWDRHTLSLGGQFYGASGRDASVLGTSNLGGFLSLSGFSENELVGKYATHATASYYYRINQQTALFDAPLFIGVSAEAGNVYQSFDAINLDNLIYAGSAFAGIDSPLGPIFLGIGFNDEGRQSVYFSIGSFF